MKPPSPLERAQTAFLRRAVGYLAADLRVRQYITLGADAAAVGAARDAAREHVPDPHFLRIDTDSVPSLAGRGQAGEEEITVLRAGGLPAGELIGRLRVRGLVDFTAPVAVFVLDAQLRLTGPLQPHKLAATFHAVLCPGSHLAITRPPHGCPDTRSREHTAELFAPFRLIEPGLADMAWWPYPDEEVTGRGTGVLAGVARRS
ncbi:hypothetical protein GCM10027294_05280 [Marinactinospora endophytica]